MVKNQQNSGQNYKILLLTKIDTNQPWYKFVICEENFSKLTWFLVVILKASGICSAIIIMMVSQVDAEKHTRV